MVNHGKFGRILINNWQFLTKLDYLCVLKLRFSSFHSSSSWDCFSVFPLSSHFFAGLVSTVPHASFQKHITFLFIVSYAIPFPRFHMSRQGRWDGIIRSSRWANEVNSIQIFAKNRPMAHSPYVLVKFSAFCAFFIQQERVPSFRFRFVKNSFSPSRHKILKKLCGKRKMHYIN